MADYTIPDDAGAGDRIERHFTARLILADTTEHQVIVGTVSTPKVLLKDSGYRQGATFSDSPRRVKGWLRQQLPRPQTDQPGRWEIALD